MDALKRGFFYVLNVMSRSNVTRTAQRSLFTQEAICEKSNQNGNAPVARLSTYMKSHEALWRMLASYPKDMPVEDAIRRARIDFTKARKEVVA